MKGLKKVQKIIGILMLILVCIIVIYGVFIFLPNKNNKQELEVEEEIKYGYITYKRDSKEYKEIFNKLKSVLEQDTIDYSKYAEYIGELFVMDFYTLDNKTNKNDVGGIQYLKEELKENFILNATNTMYKYIENSDDRNTELPIVKGISSVIVTKGTYEIDKISYEAYIIDLTFDYEKDLGYDSTASITAIKDDEKLYIVEKK